MNRRDALFLRMAELLQSNGQLLDFTATRLELAAGWAEISAEVAAEVAALRGTV